MDGASLRFVLFGLGAALLSNCSRSRVWRSIVLALASLVFLYLLAPNPIVFLPLIGFLGLGYVALALPQHGWSRTMTGSILAIVLVYVWLKKYSFLPESSFLHFPYFTLGLSYVFFRILHLVIESGECRETRQVSLGEYLLYTLNFTTLVSGPIQTFDEFAQDLFTAEPAPLGPSVIGLQLERIIRGFFKVNVLAMLLHAVQQDALGRMFQPLMFSIKLVAAIELALVYPIFLYANFSGYIDVVIALARLMRLRLPENFDRPFASSSVLDFWNRWHMTLSNWLKIYVYNPLLMALMRRVPSPSLQPFLGVLCFFVTFFLIGVWHGRTSEFIVFGVLTGGGISINKLWQLWLTRLLGRKDYKELAKNAAYRSIARGLNFVWFAFTLFWFWADWARIDRIFASLNMLEWIGVALIAWLLATAVLETWERLRQLSLSVGNPSGPLLTSRYARVVYASALGLVAFIITVLLNQPAPDIVYKAF